MFSDILCNKNSCSCRRLEFQYRIHFKRIPESEAECQMITVSWLQLDGYIPPKKVWKPQFDSWVQFLHEKVLQTVHLNHSATEICIVTQNQNGAEPNKIAVNGKHAQDSILQLDGSRISKVQGCLFHPFIST